MPSEVLAREGRKELRRLYTDNLRRVLKSVVDVLEFVNGKVIISADHGEFLGEDFHELTMNQKKQILSNSKGNIVQKKKKLICSHLGNFNHPILKEVPWCEIDT